VTLDFLELLWSWRR